ncbi:hypothetical protein [Bacillus cereus]|uniref:hypothetical protein n=1 Tax=Bacillus cereus TaxID=1396 RepID=UPI0015CEFBA9|nr:hypothetical protein [Bacillus cereus]
MLKKQKIFIFFTGLIASIIPTNSTHAAGAIIPTRDEIRINDIEGNPIVFGKKYILYTD